MKKIIRFLTLITLVLAVMFSMTACNFVLQGSGSQNNGGGTIVDGGGSDNGEDAGGGSGGGNVTENDGSSGSVDDSRDDVNTSTPLLIKGVTFTTRSSEDRQLLETTDAIKKVERSVVAIEMADGLGSGVILDMNVENGSADYVYVVTCHHVIGGKGDITVYLPSDKAETSGNPNYDDEDFIFTGKIGGTILENADKAVTLVGGDLRSDIAVIKINVTKPARSGKVLDKSKIVKAVIPPKSYSVQRGESVFAIGNPTGELPGWVSCGNIASLEEEAFVSDIGNMLLMGIAVPTNPGNSGGGLFNEYGELIGITNAGNTNYTAINYAIPLYTSEKDVENKIDGGVLNIVKDLMGTATDVNYGYVPNRRALFGFTVAKLTGTEYPTVSSVNADSLASSAGLKANDIITAIQINSNEKVTIDTYEKYIEAMDSLVMGDTIKLTVSRKNGLQTITAVVTLTVSQYHFCNTGEFPPAE